MGYAQDLVNKGYYGYAGWGDAEASADFRATGGSGKGGPSSPSSSSSYSGANITPQTFTANPVQSAIDISKSLREQNIQASQPAIQTLQSGIDPLKDRYSKLIEDIKGRRDTAIQQTGISTATEFGKRGIPLSSGVYDVALRGATTPVEQSYNQSILGAEGESQDKQRAIQTAIASLQSGAGNVSMSDVLNILSTSKTLSTPAASTNKTEVVEAGGRKLLVTYDTGGNVVSKQDLGASKEGDGTDFSQLAALFGSGVNTQGTTEPKPTNPPLNLVYGGQSRGGF